MEPRKQFHMLKHFSCRQDSDIAYISNVNKLYCILLMDIQQLLAYRKAAVQIDTWIHRRSSGVCRKNYGKRKRNYELML